MLVVGKRLLPLNSVFHGGMLCYTHCVIFNGSPYWLNIQSNIENSRLLVIWFDVRNEVFTFQDVLSPLL